MDKVMFEAYTRPNGHNEFLEYLDGLSKTERSKLLSILDKVQKYGLGVGFKNKWLASIDTQIYEIRTRSNGRFQRALYFHDVGDKYIITHGFNKKTNQTPQREINHAHQIMGEYYETDSKH